MNQPLILSGARTPFATWAGGTTGAGVKGGALKPIDPFDLAAGPLKASLSRAGLTVESPDVVVFGNMYNVGAHALYGGRYVAHRAGLPDRTPGYNVGFACGTGLYSIISGAEQIQLGKANVVGVTGADNCSIVRRDVFVPSFKDLSCNTHIAMTAEVMAAEYGFSRQDIDRWALRSHQAALRAQKAGIFAEEIEPIGGISADDYILPDAKPEFFAAAKLLFEDGGTTATSANTHAIVDGGSALIMASEEGAKAAKAPPLGRFLAGAVVGLEPKRMAFASVVAIRRVLELARLSLQDIDLFEINETFAAQMIIDIKELGLPEDKVNVNGGALALGHPFAATGCRLVMTLLKELGRRGQKRGVASICIGAGQGVAVAVERL